MNWKGLKLQNGYRDTVSSGTALLLTVDDVQFQFITGTVAQTVKMPSGLTTSKGKGVITTLVNDSTAAVTLQDFGGNFLKTIAAGTAVDILLQDHTSANGVWKVTAFASSGGGGAGSVAPGSTLSANYTILTTDTGRVLLVNTLAGAFTVQLPTPVAGFVVTVKDMAGNAHINPITVLRASAEMIDGITASAVISKDYGAETYVSDGTDWYRVGNHADVFPSSFGFGIVFGGSAPANSPVIDVFNMQTQGNSPFFGNLFQTRTYTSAAGSRTRAVSSGGYISGPTFSNVIDYIDIATKADATSFATAAALKGERAGLGNSIRGVYCGYGDPAATNIDYITFTILGTQSSFGNLTAASILCGGASNQTRGLISGVDVGANGRIDYLQIATAANSQTFGTFTANRRSSCGAGSRTMALWGGGEGYTNDVSFSMFATLAASANFSTLSSNRSTTGAANALIAVWSGGYTGSIYVATMDYSVFAAAAVAQSFGNISTARGAASACSNAHGGI